MGRPEDMVLVKRGDLRDLAMTVCGPHGELDWLGPPSNVDTIPAHPVPGTFAWAMSEAVEGRRLYSPSRRVSFWFEADGVMLTLRDEWPVACEAARFPKRGDALARDWEVVDAP